MGSQQITLISRRRPEREREILPGRGRLGEVEGEYPSMSGGV